jgi:hypothetical protein
VNPDAVVRAVRDQEVFLTRIVPEHQVEGAAAHAERGVPRTAAFRARGRSSGHQEVRHELALPGEDVDAIEVAIAESDLGFNALIPSL